MKGNYTPLPTLVHTANSLVIPPGILIANQKISTEMWRNKYEYLSEVAIIDVLHK